MNARRSDTSPELAFPASKLTEAEIMRRLAMVAHSAGCGSDPGYGFRLLMVKAGYCSVCCSDHRICSCDPRLVGA